MAERPYVVGRDSATSITEDSGARVERVRARLEVWNIDTLEWERMTQPDTGEGGGSGMSFAEFQTIVPDEAGTWGYNAGVSGTVNLSGGKRVIGIAAIATEAGASMSINGGDSIPIPDDVGLEMAPRGNLVNPTIVFTGTAAYVIEHLS
jgi:hypothetical protein